MTSPSPKGSHPQSLKWKLLFACLLQKIDILFCQVLQMNVELLEFVYPLMEPGMLLLPALKNTMFASGQVRSVKGKWLKHLQ